MLARSIGSRRSYENDLSHTTIPGGVVCQPGGAWLRRAADGSIRIPAPRPVRGYRSVSSGSPFAGLSLVRGGANGAAAVARQAVPGIRGGGSLLPSARGGL